MSSFITLTDLIYPVGSYYISNSSTSPASLFGGSWVRITSRFLYSSNSSSGTGGSDSHTHVYGITAYTNTGSFVEGKTDAAILRLRNYQSGGAWTERATSYTETYDTSGTVGVTQIGRTAVQQVVRQQAIANVSYSNTKPPYRTCYMWYRSS